MSLFSLPLRYIHIPYNSGYSSEVSVIRQNVAAVSQSPRKHRIPTAMTASTQTRWPKSHSHWLSLCNFSWRPHPSPSLYLYFPSEMPSHFCTPQIEWSSALSPTVRSCWIRTVCTASYPWLSVTEKRSWFSRVHSHVRGRGSHVIAEDTILKDSCSIGSTPTAPALYGFVMCTPREAQNIHSYIIFWACV